MDEKKQTFAAKLMDTFKVEATEHLKGISDGLLALEGNALSPEKRLGIIESIFRNAHSLKGSARAVGIETIQDICQSLENVLSDLRHDKIQLARNHFDILYETVDLIGKYLEEGSQDISVLLGDLTNKLNDLGATEGTNSPVSKSNSDPKPATTDPFSSTTIRVSLQKLDRLMQEVEELLMLKLITNQRNREMAHIQKEVSDWQKGWNRSQVELRKMRQAWEGEIKSYTPTKDFLNFLEVQSDRQKGLNDKMQALAKTAGQDARFVSSIIDGALDDAKQILMLPLSAIFEIFPRMVRDLSHTLQKNVALIIQGDDIEVDRRILEEMKDPLIHIIRNCIDHGIEPQEIRLKNQKPEEGHLILSATQTSGNTVEISITDDGQGIEIDKVKKAAIEAGHLTEREAKTLSDEEALKLIYTPGISTSPIITDLSGRGVGMGVVLEKVEKLGGAIRIQTKSNIGTTFTISLPLTMATFRGLHVQASGQDFIFPTQYLIRVIRTTPDQIQTVEGVESISVSGSNLSYIHLSDLLDLKKSAQAAKYIYAIVVKVTETLFAIGVEAILNEQEVFIKSLGKQLARVKNIAAATIMEEGKIIPILDPFDLKKYLPLTHTRTGEVAADKVVKKRSILVVEDSSTARLMLKNIFEGAGYQVKTAVNGLDALTAIKAEIIDLMVSDVEMPHMDGFTLTEKLRNIEKYKDLPIVLCTSRGSQEDREHGIEVGANAYIDKSSFAQSNLLEIVKKLL